MSKKMLVGKAIKFNPSESIINGSIAKKIPMGALTEFQRKINGFEYSEYNNGPKFRNGDTVVAKITPCLENGKTAFVDILDDNEIAFGSSEFIVLRKTEYTDSEFIYYFARSPLFRERAINCMEGTSGRKRVNENTLKNLEFVFPDLTTQKSIAKVLSDLDTKIEINNRISRELEAMAKTLYDYWFVQFDFPNEQSKPYKSSGGKMVYNAELKREIPEGWEVKKLSQIANITMGQSPSGSSYNDDGIGEIFFQGSTDFGWRYPTIRQYTTEPSRMAKSGDILLSVRAPVGTLNIADNDCCIGRGLTALNSKSGYDSYLYYVMEYFKQIFDHRNNAGTTFGSITKDDLHSLKLVYPKDDLLKKYNQTVSKFNQMILINHKQNQHLTALRDWLLPMLMNGQVTVRQTHGNAVQEAEERLSMAAEPSVEYKKG